MSADYFRRGRNDLDSVLPFRGGFRVTLGATTGAPFDARKYLREQGHAFRYTGAFRRVANWRLRRIGHAHIVHIHAEVLNRTGFTLKRAAKQLSTHHVLDLAHAIELLSRQETDPNLIFSSVRDTYVHIGPMSWFVYRPKSDGPILDAQIGYADARPIPRGSHFAYRTGGLP